MTAQPLINKDIRNWKTMRGTLYDVLDFKSNIKNL